MMRKFNSLVLTVLLAVLCGLAAAQTNAPTTTAALRILAPKPGESLSNDFVTVQYALESPASAASTPTFQLRLDNSDPVQTTDTQYNFTGLAAGTHTVTIQVLDANGTPIPGLRNEVQFTVPPPQNGGTPLPHSSRPVSAEDTSAHVENAAMNWQALAASQSGQEPSPAHKSRDQQLPTSGSALPLLSVIGMGVLVGGIASALRTRHSNGR
jgi:hypothetical protein